MACHRVGGEAAGEGVFTRFVSGEAEFALAHGLSHEVFRARAAWEPRLGYLQLFCVGLVDDDGAVRHGAGIDESDVYLRADGDGQHGLAMGVAVEVHAVVRGIEGGDEGDLYAAWLGPGTEEIFGGDAGEEFLFQTGDLHAVIMPRRWRRCLGEGDGAGDGGGGDEE